MTIRYIEVLDPTGVAKGESIAMAVGAGDLNGKVIGLIDNGKPNYDVFLDRLEALLSQRFKFAGIIHAKKGEKDAGAPLDEADMEKLAAECQVVLNGICDWGSCTSWSIHDSAELEKKGIPTVTICSDAFVSLARAVALSRGIPELPMVVIPHPIAGVPADRVRAKADEAIDEIVRCLVGA